MEEVKNQEQGKQTIIINQQSPRSNGIGVAGFVLALIALFLGWVPVWGWLLTTYGLHQLYIPYIFLLWDF